MNIITNEVSQSAFASLIRFMAEAGSELHSIELFRDGKLLLAWSLSPYSRFDKREMYSVSKSFTSTAFGIAFDRSLIHPEDPVCALFPEYQAIWEKDSRWERLTFHHLLTMSSGHPSCVMDQMAQSPDSVAAFFSAPLQHEPGERFVYNTGATCIVAEAVRRVTGLTVPELLARDVFPYIGIEDFSWERIADGRCAGGTGLSVSCDDLARLGLLYLNRGVFNGRRILSEQWVKMASSAQIPNPDNGTADWCSGYGYQFWCNEREGFRADGAFGQVCFVLPKHNMVCAITTESTELAPVFTAIQDFLHEQNREPACISAPLDAYDPLMAEAPEPFDSGWRTPAKNPCGFSGIRLCLRENQAVLSLATEAGVQCVRAGFGSWIENLLFEKEMRPSLYMFADRSAPQAIRFCACARKEADGVYLDCRSLNTPHHFGVKVVFPDNRLLMTLESPLDVFGAEKRIIEQNP